MKYWIQQKKIRFYFKIAAAVLVLGIIVVIINKVDMFKKSSEFPELSWQWQYDDSSRLSEIIGPGDVPTQMKYIQANKEKDEAEKYIVKFIDEQREYTFDSKDRLAKAENTEGTIEFSYNTFGLPARVQSSDAPDLYYDYNLQHRIAEMRIGKSTSIGYQYDYLGRLETIITPAGEIKYNYQRGMNTIIRQLPNGIKTYRKYDEEGQLIELTHVDAENYIIAKYAYSYRPDGLIEGITENNQHQGNRVFQYEYDLMQRLTDVRCEGNGQSFHYAYDSLGNLIESTNSEEQSLHFTSSSSGALMTDSRGASQTDKRGHICQLPGSSASIDYSFNGAGELSAASEQDLQYTHNALGLLSSRTVKGQKTQYLPDPFVDAWHPLWQRDGVGNEAVMVWDDSIPLIEIRDKNIIYRLEDHLSSVRIVTDKRGKIKSWNDYTPYGMSDEVQGSNSALTPGFAGLIWDPVAKVYLAMARAYDPVIARFLQPDPELRIPNSTKQSHSLYAYCGGDPLNFTDMNGAAPRSLMLTDGIGKAASGLSLPFDSRFPPLRQNVIREIYRNAQTQALRELSIKKENPTPSKIEEKTWNVVERWWRSIKNGNDENDEYKKLYPSATTARDHEWQTTEHYALIRAATVVGEAIWFGYDVKDRPKVSKLGVENYNKKWIVAHSFGEHPLLRGKQTSGSKNIMGRISPETVLIAVGYKKVPNPIKAIKDIWFTGKYTNADNKKTEVSEWLPLHPMRSEIIKMAFQDADDVKYGTYPLDVSVGNSTKLTPEITEYQRTGISNMEYLQRRLDARDLTQSIMSQIKEMQGIQRKYDTTGRNGLVAGPGGFASPQAYDALAGWKSSRLASPSPVGGVYLGGAGKALEGLGKLKGVAIDEITGKLILIGEDADKISLPPLRMDDIVTVFRTVYDYGDSPTVTIDPDEQDPKGPIMHVKHGPGTEGTYVGWILFECDRIMKSYQLGKDNNNGEIVRSQIPGYPETLEKVFFGEPNQDIEKDSVWERFWIVPDVVRRFDASASNLSLFELPLRVNTQKMRWRWGKLEDDKKGKSSPGAIAFTNWFSKHYDEIADEVFLNPPSESGLTAPVAIFHELCRIALITAVAEKLRDQGELMPSWMRDYKVAYFPVDETTKSLTLKKTKTEGTLIRTARIYGGVNLAPADKDIRKYSDVKVADAATDTIEDIAFVDLSKKETISLQSKIPELSIANDHVGMVQAITMPKGDTLSAVVLPSADTRALAPNRQAVTDLVVPIGMGYNISLTRYYNSFFDPEGPLGKGWTLNLPQLRMTKIPIKRDGMQSEYRIIPQIINPLGSMEIRFDEKKYVESFKIEMLVAKEYPEIAGFASGDSEIVDAKTQQVIFHNGTTWHFDENNWLVLLQNNNGTATRYIRDSAGQIGQILGYVGKDAVAELRFEYDKQGRIVEVKADQADYLQKQAPVSISELAFKYGEDGRLNAVRNLSKGKKKANIQKWTYAYNANHLSKIRSPGRTDIIFGYDQRGQLLWKKQGDRKIEYSVSATDKGTTLTKDSGNTGAQSQEWTYDLRMRPLTVKNADGQMTQWQYGKNDAVREVQSRDGKQTFTRSISQNGKLEKTMITDGSTYELQRDICGRPTVMSIDGVTAAQISWNPDGRISGLRDDNTKIQPRWHKDGWQKGVVISSLINSKINWFEKQWDVMGRPIKLNDSTGFEYVINYDDEGRVKTFGRLTEDGKLMGTNFNYNSKGSIKAIDSSWSKEKRKYRNNGSLKRLEVKKQGEKSVTDFDSYGYPISHIAFDEGETKWHYDHDENGTTLLSIDLPNDKKIKYSGDDSDKTHSIKVSLGSAVVQTISDDKGRLTKLAWGE